MKKYAALLFTVFALLFHPSAEARGYDFYPDDLPEFSLSVHVQSEASGDSYVLMRSDGSMVHEPTQYEIYAVRSDDDIEVYACYVEDPNDHENDAEMLGIYIVSEDYFSGFIYNDVQWSEGYISAAYEGRYGYLDMKGNVVIPFQWTTGSPFHNGIAEVVYEASYGYAVAYIDTTGTIVAIRPRPLESIY